MEITTPMEVELKLAIAPKHLTKLLNHPTLASMPSTQAHLANTYFDTPAGDLAHARVAVRLRCMGDLVVQTVKTAGHGGGGLSNRQEWEWQVSSHDLDREALNKLPPFQGRLAATIAHLIPNLSTDFNRKTWQMMWQDSHIELVLDRGEIVSGGAHTGICELELELKTGQPEALWSLALHLAQQVPFRPSDSSKAARGNALASQQWPLPTAASALEWLHRATVALDAYHDSGKNEHFLAAQQALNTLSQHPQLNDDLRHIAKQLPQELSEKGQPTATYGHLTLTLAHRLAPETTLR